MHLKKVEIVGFKSFLNKTVCKFEPGVTAIVGPNGCGKSNIVDAMKWVFGEQSPKSMRSSSMQDVIFNGTDKFDAVNMAEVSITLSNEDKMLPVDYEEVTITRRLFRSGESEYLINKTPVRLMDVKRLLMGTGLGTSSYSVIEQGRMDLVISSKPEERRFVFEEASGITRYKSQKREALLKLERTQDNLTRVNDIILEVERQIKAIERQARKADRYKALYEELKDMELKLSWTQLNELDKAGSSKDTEFDESRKVEEGLKKDIGELHEILDKHRVEYNHLMEELQKDHAEVMKLESEIDKNNHIMSVNTERIDELEKYVQRMGWEIEQAVQRKETLRENVNKLQMKWEEVSKRRSEKENKLNSDMENVRQISERAERHELELKLDTDKNADLANEKSTINAELIRINADIQNNNIRIKRLDDNVLRLKNEERSVEHRLEEMTLKRDDVNRELNSKKDEFNRFNTEFINKQQKLAYLSEKRIEKERRKHEIRPRIELLEKQIAEREGISDAVKEIISMVEGDDAHIAGVHGILSELIKVREGYEEALESILGDFAQSIVVDSRDVMERVAALLEARSLDSVNFIILDELGMISEPGVLEEEGQLFKAINHIFTEDNIYAYVLARMLSNTFVADSTDSIRKFIDLSEDFGGKIICGKGEIYLRGGHRTANHSKSVSMSLFGRKEKLEELISEEKRIDIDLNDMAEKISVLEKWVSESFKRKEQMENKLRNVQLEFADLSSKCNGLKEKHEMIQRDIDNIETELKEMTDLIDSLRSQSVSFNARLEEIDAETTEIVHKIEIRKRDIDTIINERNIILSKVSDLKAELSALTKEEEHVAENLAREKNSLNDIDGDIDNKKIGMDESAEKIELLGKESVDLKEKNTEYSSLKESKIFAGAEKKGQKDRLSGLINVAENDLKEKEAKLEQLRNSSRDIEIIRKEIDYKKQALVERMLETYKTDIRGISFEIEEDFDRDGARAMIDEYKNKIERMGEVSLGAATELKELQERFEFLSTQRDDLDRSRTDLLNAIAKINRTTRKMFMETFEAIKKEFSNYFKMLFKGGYADLVLEDERDILECGIDIVVRPPGKKLQNLMLLSGGEKAMTAIALIFGIFKVNPSPFCILDEIDAPLDESNVVRFATVLEEFLKLSQFIIVTHNRMTIQLADVLYGVTMEEKGVSKIVSVKFKEEDKITAGEEIPAAV